METYLVHYGIKGQKWGIRKYQNPDGSLTPAGRQRYYGSGERKSLRTRYLEKSISAIDRDIHSFDNIKNGTKTKSGRKVLTKKDVSDQVKALESVKNRQLEKLKYSQKYDKADRYGRAVLKSQKSDNKILELRQKNRERLENKYKKQIQKGKITKQDAKKRLSEFDNATVAVKSGLNRYNNIISKYGKMKAKAAIDPSIKESKAYKDAAKAYMNQKFSDLFSTGGSDYTKLKYTSEELRKNKNN